MDSSALSTNTLIAVQGTPREHASKVIGDQFPDSGYGISSASLPSFTQIAHLSAIDEFYVFDKDAPVSIPTRLSSSDLPKANFIQDIVHPRDRKKEPVVELSSEKSGIKLDFFTNRKILSNL